MKGRTIAAAVALTVVVGLAVAVALVRGPGPDAAKAASHREAPLISLDPTADITDFFMFRSYEPGRDGNVVLAMDVIPGETPSSGPNYYNLDPNVAYTFNVDNNADGKAEDVQFEIRVENQFVGPVQSLGLPLSFLGDVPPGDGSIVPPITTLDSAGIGLKQTYSVTMIKRGSRTVLGDGLPVVPSNIGPRTTPGYPALSAQGVQTLANGVRAFVGQKDDPFYIDLGATFDTLNLRRTPPLLTTAEDANDSANPFGRDQLGGLNIHELALEVPITALTADGKSASETTQPKLGGYASTSRPRITVRGVQDGGASHGRFVQVQRLANPLVNELVIGTIDKDRWNAEEPEDESDFLGYYLKPRIAAAFQLVFGFDTGCTPFGTPECSPDPPAPTDLTLGNFNRTDLVNVLLKYKPTDTRLSELLRLDLSVPPTPLGQQKRLTLLAHDAAGNPTADNAGWPNGRRPIDDVTDIAIRVVGGPNYINALAGDGVNVNDAPLSDTFPFLATAWDGRAETSGSQP
jgi:hypothetical protein